MLWCAPVSPCRHLSGCSELPNWCRAVGSPLGAVWLRGQRSCYVCDCESTVDVMINYILWMTRQYPVKENEGSRTPPLYSLPCVVHRLFVSWQPSFVAIDGVVLAETRCRPCLLLIFTPCTPLSTCLQLQSMILAINCCARTDLTK